MANRRVPVRLQAALARYIGDMARAQRADDGRPWNNIEVPNRHRDHTHIGRRFSPGGYVPVEGWYKLGPDECVVRPGGPCIRADHPTSTSDCSIN